MSDLVFSLNINPPNWTPTHGNCCYFKILNDEVEFWADTHPEVENLQRKCDTVDTKPTYFYLSRGAARNKEPRQRIYKAMDQVTTVFQCEDF